MATIQLFEKGAHIRDDFKNRHSSLEHYIKRYARQDGSNNLSRCFVLTDGDSHIKGYYTLSKYTVEIENWDDALAKKYNLIKYKAIPCTLIGRLAVDSDCEARGYGKKLLMHALRTAFEVSKSIASFAVIVDAIDQNAKNFYMKYGFCEFPSKPEQLFLTMKHIAQVVNNSESKLKRS